MKYLFFLFFFFSIFFFSEITGLRQWYCCDNLLINIPARVFQARELAKGVFPLWNPALFSGTPFFADINLSPLYPGNGIFFFFAPFEALRISILVHIFLGMVGMYWLGKRLFFSGYAALVASIVFGFSGTLLSYADNLPMLQVAVYTPWIVLLLHRCIRSKSMSSYLVVVIVMSLQIVAGHPQLTFYSWLLYASYIVYFYRFSLKKRLSLVAILGLAVFGLTALQLVPFLEFVFHSTRTTGSFEHATIGSLLPLWILRLFVPTIVGDATAGTAWVQEGSAFGFTTATAYIVMIAYLKKTRQVLFWSIVGITSLVLSFGRYTPIYYLAYHFFPGIGLFRVPIHFLFLTTIAVAVLAGYSIDSFVRIKSLPTTQRYAFVWKLFLFFAGSCFVIAAVISPDMLLSLGTLHHKVSSKLTFLGLSGVKNILYAVGCNMLLLALISFFVFERTGRFTRIMAARIFLGFLCVELFFYARRAVNTEATQNVNKIFQYARDAAGKISDKPGRFFVSPSLYPAFRNKQFGLANNIEENYWQAQILRPNIGMLFGISSIDGYASLIYKEYARYIGSTTTDPTGVSVPDVFTPAIGALGLHSYSISNKDQSLFLDTEFTHFISDTDKAVLFKTGSTPLVYAVRDKKRIPLTSTKQTSQTVTLTVSTDRVEQIILATSSYPGWHVIVNDKQMALEKYEGFLPSVTLGPGKHFVVFYFLSYSVIVGTLMSLGTLSIWLVCFFTSMTVREREAKNTR